MVENGNAGRDAASRPVHVSFVSLVAYPMFDPRVIATQGGSAVDIYMIATELAKDPAFRVSLITADYGQARRTTIENVDIYRTTDLAIHPVAGCLELWRVMRSASASIFFAKGASLTTALVTLFAKFQQRPVCIRTASEFECNGSYHRRYPLRGRALSWAMKQASVLLVQAEAHRSALTALPGSTVHSIPNGHVLTPSPSDVRDTVLWVGRSARLKNPNLFLRLAKALPSEKFLMICQRSRHDGLFHRLRERARDIANLELIDFVLFTEIDQWFRRSKLVVNTSDGGSEGFPNVFIQAGKNGAPILSLNVNPDGFLDKYKCGLCAAGDWERFVGQARFLLGSDEQQEYGSRAHAYVNEHHDIRKNIERYKELFLRISAAPDASDGFETDHTSNACPDAAQTRGTGVGW